ncbi:Detected protein of confused Function [Hibiscus syriacus]|uniref:Detected protein of confused Function n=1 Tax=Hibiscus syriacus TaxID=106335 RepID=A0A6A2WK17_HIBSY|nr:protein CHUP1, chloroplastic-like [Hibiscus syriacus]KAE8659538.1 Detected protein of confused Function [Hibiscus syriacus]
MSKEKRDLRLLLLKIGVVVAISSAGLLYARFRTRKTKRHLPSPPPSRRVSDCCSEADDCGEDDASDLRMAPASDPEEISVEKDDDELEIKRLRNMVRMLRERERNLEAQLLEYYSLKEQEAVVMELENQLKKNNMEAKPFTLKIASLQSENQRLENQVADHSKVAVELQATKSRIEVLKKKLRKEAEQNREQILNVQKRVAKLKEEELKAPVDNHDIQSNSKRLKVLEGEAEELRKSNTRLQIENTELARKLESTQILENSVLEDPELEAINKTQERLRQENEELKKQIEQLQEDRCSDAEELVHLQWVNACLRYELRNLAPSPGKTVARDLSKSLSPESEEKAKKLILKYAHTEGTWDRGMNSMDFDSDHLSCSQAFYDTDNGQVDGSAKKTPNSGKTRFLKKLGRLILGKDGSALSRKSVADSPTWSSGSGNDFVNTLQSKSDRWFTTSHSSSATTFDVDQVKAIDKFRRNSDLGLYGYRRLGSGRDAALEPQLHQGSQ